MKIFDSFLYRCIHLCYIEARQTAKCERNNEKSRTHCLDKFARLYLMYRDITLCSSAQIFSWLRLFSSFFECFTDKKTKCLYKKRMREERKHLCKYQILVDACLSMALLLLVWCLVFFVNFAKCKCKQLFCDHTTFTSHYYYYSGTNINSNFNIHRKAFAARFNRLLIEFPLFVRCHVNLAFLLKNRFYSVAVAMSNVF